MDEMEMESFCVVCCAVDKAASWLVVIIVIL